MASLTQTASFAIAGRSAASRSARKPAVASPAVAARAPRSAGSASFAGRAVPAASRRAAGVAAKGRGLHVLRAAGGVDVEKVKMFLDEMSPLGSIRLIVNTGVSVLESVTDFSNIFYSPVPGKGVYGNLIKPKENVDFHLLISKVASIKFESTQGRGGNYMSHVLRLTDIKGDVCVSLFLMWPEGAERGAYAPGQVEAFQALQKKWLPTGEVLSFMK